VQDARRPQEHHRNAEATHAHTKYATDGCGALSAPYGRAASGFCRTEIAASSRSRKRLRLMSICPAPEIFRSRSSSASAFPLRCERPSREGLSRIS
jgi:hypothetical protein